MAEYRKYAFGKKKKIKSASKTAKKIKPKSILKKPLSDEIFSKLPDENIPSPNEADNEQPVSNNQILEYFSNLLGVAWWGAGEWGAGEWTDDINEQIWIRHIKWVKKNRPSTYQQEKQFHTRAYQLLRMIRQKTQRIGANVAFNPQAQNYLQQWNQMKEDFFDTIRLYYS